MRWTTLRSNVHSRGSRRLTSGVAFLAEAVCYCGGRRGFCDGVQCARRAGARADLAKPCANCALLALARGHGDLAKVTRSAQAGARLGRAGRATGTGVGWARRALFETRRRAVRVRRASCGERRKLLD